MVSFETLIGFLAGVLTTASHIPQLYKSWTSGETKDLSLKMILVLGTGLALWCAYGIVRGDLAIILANGISVLLLSGILYFKLRPSPRHNGKSDMRGGTHLPPAAGTA
jgi:MtN3 and saliva related transmembrane protein